MIISANTMGTVWSMAVKRIMNHGFEVKDERGSDTKELLNLTTIVTNPEDGSLPEKYPLKKGGEEYRRQLLDKNLAGFVYTYGNRLRNHFEEILIEYDDAPPQTAIIDQVQEVIRRLNACKESRRAVMVTYDPSIDFRTEEIPCLIMVDFKIRKNKLLTTAVWRSHDIYGAYPTNWIALRELAVFVAEKVGVNLGHITIHSLSAHIYSHNWIEANRV